MYYDTMIYSLLSHTYYINKWVPQDVGTHVAVFPLGCLVVWFLIFITFFDVNVKM